MWVDLRLLRSNPAELGLSRSCRVYEFLRAEFLCGDCRGGPCPGEDDLLRERLLSPDIAGSNGELGALELPRLEDPWAGGGVSMSGISGLLESARACWFAVSIQPEEEPALLGRLGTGLLVLDIQTPSTSIPRSSARMPNGSASSSFCLS
jgi:hypothetical protein